LGEIALRVCPETSYRSGLQPSVPKASKPQGYALGWYSTRRWRFKASRLPEYKVQLWFLDRFSGAKAPYKHDSYGTAEVVPLSKTFRSPMN
jgi:hypothetical protein